MIKKNKILLVLGCLSLGVGGIGLAQAVSGSPKEADATSATYSFAFSKAADLVVKGGSFSSGGIAWTYDSITALNYDSTKGIQLGTSSAPMNKAWTFHTALSNFGSGVTSITVNGSIALGGDAKVSVTAGTTTLISATALTTSAADYTGTSGTALSSGELTITFTNTVKAEYFKSVSVIYTEKSYDSVQSITLSKTSGTYSVMGGETITATVLPAGANQQVSWSSSDEFVATVSAGTIYAAGKGTATITATTIGTGADGLVKTATFAVTVNDFGISDLRDSAGAILNSGKIVAVTGTVTKVVAGAGVYIQTGTTFAGARAVYGYNVGATASSATVGNLCTIKGTITSYNGLLELSGALYKTSTTAGETITPIAISSGFTSANLVGHDSVMISLPSLRLTAATTITSGTASTISCTLGGNESVSLRAEKTVSSADATTINTMFGKIGTGGAFSYSGVLGWYNAPQASLTEASQLSLPSATSTEITNVETFVSTYLNITAGTCSERWSAAKTAYLALAAEEQAIFKTGSAYADMLKRYNAWAAANGDTALSSPEVSANGDSMNIVLYTIGGMAILAAGAFFVFRKKKQA